MAENPRKIDLSGKRFGRWLISHQAGNENRGGTLWLGRCDCGVERIVRGADLRKGKSTNCGCQNVHRLGDSRRTHGGTGSRLHRIWKNMRGRCYRPSNPGFEHYGGRGIGICAEWQKYPVFRDWALANGYSDDLSIERIDVDGDYSPANCTWATPLVQANNRRFVRKMPDGRSAPMVARANGIPVRTFNVRVAAGWSIEEAATHPYGKLRKPRPRDSEGRYL